MTPQEVFDKYLLLSPSEMGEFLRMVGSVSSADAAWVLVSSFGPIERDRFTTAVFNEMFSQFFPVVFRTAREVAKENRDISDDEFDAELYKRVAQLQAEYDQAIGEREATKLKAKRDRKPDPETIRRNVEICDLRKTDKRHWSQGRLAKKYHITTRAIRSILKDETKWRKLAARMGED